MFIQRRDFIKNGSLALTTPLLLGCRGDILAQRSNVDLLSEIKKNARTAPADLEWAGAKDAPANVGWRTSLASSLEEGESILVSGTIYRADGKTPAPDVLIYLYHTDIHGYYGRGSEHRHGRYRGWMLTDAAGRYEFRSIKPASYPDSTVASHIHMTLTGKDFQEDWVDSILFEGDRFLTEAGRRPRKGGFEHVLKFEKGRDGVSLGVRNILTPV